MNQINYPFKEKKSIKILFVVFIICSLLTLASSIFFFIKSFQAIYYIVLGIIAIVFTVLFVIESIYLIVHKTILTDNSIIQYGIFGKNEIVFNSNCNVEIEETTSSTASKITILVKNDKQSILLSNNVDDYTVDACYSFYVDWIKPLRDKQLKIDFSPLLLALAKSIEKKYSLSSNNDVNNLFVDYNPDEKEDIKARRKKKVKSLVITLVVLELMVIFLLVLQALKPIINKSENYTYSTNDIIFMILYGVFFIFILIYMLYQIHRILNKKDKDIK